MATRPQSLPARALADLRGEGRGTLNARALADGAVELTLYGDIGPEAYGFEINAVGIERALRGLGEASEIRVRLNSPGGIVTEGHAIYNLLHQAKARVVVDVDGLAASAASVVAMAGDEIRIAENAFMMIHDPWSIAMGSADDLRSEAAVLDKMAGAIAQTYAARTGQSVEQMTALMAAETWMTADEAVEQGFATSVTRNKTAAPSAHALNPAAFALWRNAPAALVAAMAKPAPKQEAETMSIPASILEALNLAADADDVAVVAKIKATRSANEAAQNAATFAAFVEEIAGVQGDAALGVLNAWKASHAEVARLQKEAADAEFAKLITDGKAARKITPANEEKCSAMSLDTLRAFLDAAHPAGPSAPAKPLATEGSADGQPKHEGKTFVEMQPAARKALKDSDPDTYNLMRDDAKSRGLI